MFNMVQNFGWLDRGEGWERKAYYDERFARERPNNHYSTYHTPIPPERKQRLASMIGTGILA